MPFAWASCTPRPAGARRTDAAITDLACRVGCSAATTTRHAAATYARRPSA